MFIALKNNKITAISDLDWKCRQEAKGLLTTGEYWTWLKSVTSVDEKGYETYDFSGEDYTIRECKGDFESWFATGLIVLQVADVTLYHLKWDGSEVVKDDDAKAAWELAEEWTRIRRERDRLLTETDWMTFADSPALSDDWKTYRQTLRDLPNAQKAKTTYESITWPSKPS